MDLAFFRRLDDGTLDPLDLARSSWSADQAHGVAICGALAHEAEHRLADLGRSVMVPSRVTVDLFRPTRMQPCRLESTVVRKGSRICLVDTRLVQDGEVTARGSVLFLQPSADPEGEHWRPDPADRPLPPPTDVAPVTDQPHVPYLHSAADWSQDFRDHQNAGRTTYWNTAPPIVLGEPVTPFEAVSASADGTSLATNWGTHGVQHINADVTLSLARRPVGVSIGIRALERVEHDGVVSASATVFDREGVLGTSTVSAIANTRRGIDMAAQDWSGDPRA